MAQMGVGWNVFFIDYVPRENDFYLEIKRYLFYPRNHAKLLFFSQGQVTEISPPPQARTLGAQDGELFDDPSILNGEGAQAASEEDTEEKHFIHKLFPHLATDSFIFRVSCMQLAEYVVSGETLGTLFGSIVS